MGSDPNLVQAGGGNTSWKNGSTIFYLDGRGFSLIFLILDLRSPELILIGISILWLGFLFLSSQFGVVKLPSLVECCFCCSCNSSGNFWFNITVTPFSLYFIKVWRSFLGSISLISVNVFCYGNWKRTNHFIEREQNSIKPGSFFISSSFSYGFCSAIFTFIF
jgi:hypothetical protein